MALIVCSNTADKRNAQFERIADLDIQSMIASDSVSTASDSVGRSGSGGIGALDKSNMVGTGRSKRETIDGGGMNSTAEMGETGQRARDIGHEHDQARKNALHVHHRHTFGHAQYTSAFAFHSCETPQRNPPTLCGV